jgi:hypothetical protein
MFCVSSQISEEWATGGTLRTSSSCPTWPGSWPIRTARFGPESGAAFFIAWQATVVLETAANYTCTPCRPAGP